MIPSGEDSKELLLYVYFSLARAWAPGCKETHVCSCGPGYDLPPPPLRGCVGWVGKMKNQMCS